LDDLVAVVGDHMWAAKCGLAALDITWNDGPNAEVCSELIWSRLRSASLRDGAVAKEVGDVKKALGSSGEASSEVVTAAFELPLLAHACMEPLNCTVHVTPTSAEAWIGTQVMERVHAAVAKAAGLPESQVTVHNHLLGGGFGRKLEPDMAYTAARIAKQVAGPVKVVWTREEDMRHDFYRPAYRDLLWARLEGDRIVGWKHRVSGSAVNARFLPAVFQKGVDPDGVASAQDIPYHIPNLRMEFNREEPPGVNTGFWRGVGPKTTCLPLRASLRNWRTRLARTQSHFVAPTWTRLPGCKQRSTSCARNQGGAHPCRSALAAASAFNSRSAVSSPRSSRQRLTRGARSTCAG